MDIRRVRKGNVVTLPQHMVDALGFTTGTPLSVTIRGDELIIARASDPAPEPGADAR